MPAAACKEKLLAQMAERVDTALCAPPQVFRERHAYTRDVDACLRRHEPSLRVIFTGLAAITPFGRGKLVAYHALLEWFRETFPYNRAECSRCGERGEILGSVWPREEARVFAVSRIEVQYCGACGSMTEFPRFNDVAHILRTRQGRCGEYAQVLYQMVMALGWRARLVLDFTDHLWVEALLPVGDAEPTAAVHEGEESAGGWRWVHLDPCEAAVDEPLLYESWGKTLSYIIAAGDGRILDVTPTYAANMNATQAERDLDPAAVRRAIRLAAIVCRPPP